MIVSKVAKRYASALFQQAVEDKVLEPVAEDMRAIGESIHGSRELLLFLKGQTISRIKKQEVLDVLFDKELNKLTRQFIKLIIEKRREDQLHGIADAFEILYKKDQGLIDVEVFVITRPEAEQSKNLKLALEQKTGNKVHLTYTVDTSLKGGMAVRIDDTVIDGTVKHKLQQLETRFHQNTVA